MLQSDMERKTPYPDNHRFVPRPRPRNAHEEEKQVRATSSTRDKVQ